LQDDTDPDIQQESLAHQLQAHFAWPAEEQPFVDLNPLAMFSDSHRIIAKLYVRHGTGSGP